MSRQGHPCARLPSRVLARRAIPLGIVVSFASLAGCFGECGPTDTASWHQPGLYDALAASGKRTTVREVPDGLPLEGAVLPASLASAKLRDIAWRPAARSVNASQERPPVDASLGVDPRERILITAPASVNESDIRAVFRAFVHNVSAAPEKWDAWEARLIASRGESGWSGGPAGEMVPIAYGYEVAVEGPYRLGALLEERGGLAGFDPARLTSPGQHFARLGEWSFGFHVPSRELREDVPSGELVILVDSLDQVLGRVEHEGASDKPATLADINAVLANLGLGPAPITAESFGTMVC